MTIRIFMSGPIRPYELSVRKAILSIRSAFPDAITYLSTWKSNIDTTTIQNEVDYYIEVDEPDVNVYKDKITVRTQTDDRPDCAPVGWKWLSWRMFYGVNILCDFASPADDDIIVRIRTDCIFRFDENEISRILRLVSEGKFVTWFAKMSGVNFTDWFAIAKYNQFKKGWYISTFTEYCQMIENRYNIEDAIKTRLIQANVPLAEIDMKKSECFLYRKNGDTFTELRV